MKRNKETILERIKIRNIAYIYIYIYIYRKKERKKERISKIFRKTIKSQRKEE